MTVREKTAPRPPAGKPWSERLRPAGKWLLIAASTLGVVVLLLALAGVFHPKVGDSAEGSHATPVGDVPQAEVQTITQPRYETSVGTIKPVHETSLASKLLARVQATFVKAGQRVEKEDVLVQLDAADLMARLKQAEAAADAAQARNKQATADLKRIKQLFAKNSVTEAEHDVAVATAESAAAEAARAKAAADEARIVLGYATIRAPFSGVVVDKRVEAGDTVSQGQVLLTLYDPAHMQLVASVRESLAQRLKVGQQLPVRLDTLGYSCEATVSEIVPEAQAASRSFSVKVTGPCPPGAYSGMFGRLLIPLEDETVTVIPKLAVRQIGQLTLVDVVSDGMTEHRYVQLGRTLDGNVEVLAGLRPGEKVVLPQAAGLGAESK